MTGVKWKKKKWDKISAVILVNYYAGSLPMDGLSYFNLNIN